MHNIKTHKIHDKKILYIIKTVNIIILFKEDKTTEYKRQKKI